VATRKLDPEALNAYRTVAREQLDKLEQELIPMLENGKELGKMPAFGRLEGAEAARTNYGEFHSTTWENLQDLREALHGVIKTLTDSGNLSEESEEENVTDINSYDDALDGSSRPPNHGTPDNPYSGI
jgi:hypothetical protein